MTEHEERALAALAAQLGMVCGALTLPAVKDGLVKHLGDPDGGFSLAAVARVHRTLGEVLATVLPDHPYEASIVPALQEYIYRAQFPFESAEWANQRAAALLDQIRRLEAVVIELTKQQGAQ